MPQMKNGLLAAAAAVATLAFANGAFAANTGSVTVWHTPMSLSDSKSTTIHVSVPQAQDPIAAVNIYAGAGYTASLTQPAGTSIGQIEATAYSWDNNLTLPLTGTVVTDAPSKWVNESTLCTGAPASAAVWVLNLSVAGQTVTLPLFVNPTSGPEQQLGPYKLSICIPPGDVPQGTPGRATNGVQLLDAKFTVNGIFTTPATAGLIKWETLFTPYVPKKGQVNRAGTFEARAFVPLPVALGLQAKYTKKTKRYTLSGNATEGGAPVAGASLDLLMGTKPSALKKVGTVTTTATGTSSKTGTLKPKKTAYFRLSGSLPERDYTATGCANPVTALAPGGCVKAMLSPWSATSPLVKISS
jgi:hypothetical protein